MNDSRFVAEVARADGLAINMHTRALGEGVGFWTQDNDSRLIGGVAGVAIGALIASAIAASEVIGLTYDQETAARLSEAIAQFDAASTPESAGAQPD
jgi:hypothetical protein